MKKILSLVLMLALLAGSCLVFASCGETERKGMTEDILPINNPTADFTVDADFKIGFIFLHDENSTYDKNFIDAANRMKTALGLTDAQVIKKTNIPEGDECYTAAADLAGQGCKIVFADSFGHEPYLLQAAREFPNVQFCHATGTMAHTEDLPNFHNAFASIYEGRYLAGVVAGMKLNAMIAAGKITADKALIGYVGAFTYAEVRSGLTSFFLGARSVCPTVTMKVQYTGSWYDEGKEQEAANALINAGCVLISQHADSMGAPSACEVAGVPNVSYNGSTYTAAPDTFLVSSAINWTPYFLYIAKCVSNGTAIAHDWCGGIAEGAVVLSGLNQDAVADGTKAKLDEVIAQFRAGTLHVFALNSFTVNGQKLPTDYMADVDTDAAYTADTVVIKGDATNGYYFSESTERSAPYFNMCIDGITELNSKF